MFRPVLCYVVVSNALLVSCMLDCISTHSDFFSRMNALANSTLFTIVVGNAIAANIVFMWLFVTMVFFWDLSGAEIDAVRQNFVSILMEVVMPFFFYSHQLWVQSNSLLFAFSCFLLLLWGSMCQVRLDSLVGMENRFSRSWKVLRLSLFLTGMCEVATLGLTMLWNAHKTDKDFYHQENTLNVFLFLYFSLIFLRSVEFILRLVVQEWCCAFVGRASRDRQQVFFRRLFSFLKSTIFIIIVLRTSCNSNYAFVLAIRPIYTNLTNIVSIPVLMFKHYAVSRRLQRVPPVTKEELEKDEIVCTICYEHIKKPKGTRRLPCLHAFHESCLRQWFEEHTTCPYCRRDLLQEAPTRIESRDTGGGDAEVPSGTPSMNLGTRPEAGISHSTPMEAGHPEIEYEMQELYLAYLNAAAGSYPDGNRETNASTVTSVATPLSTTTVENLAAEGKTQIEEEPDNDADTHGFDDQDLATFPIQRIGERVGTLRFIPNKNNSIMEVIEHEESMARQEFGRAAEAVALSEWQANDSLPDELHREKTVREGSRKLRSRMEREIPSGVRTRPSLHVSGLNGEIEEEWRSSSTQTCNDFSVDRDFQMEMDKESLSTGMNSVGEEESSGSSKDDDLKLLTRKIVERVDGVRHSADPCTSYLLRDDLPEDLRCDMDNAISKFGNDFVLLRKRLEGELSVIRSRAKERRGELVSKEL